MIHEAAPRENAGTAIPKLDTLYFYLTEGCNRDRDFWAPHWYCDEAHRQGLFPGSRLIRTQAREGGGSPASELQAIRAAKGDSHSLS